METGLGVSGQHPRAGGVAWQGAWRGGGRGVAGRR